MTTTHLYVPDGATGAYGHDPLPALRDVLRSQGHDGWSEIQLTGYWHGEPEATTRVEVIGADEPLAFWREILRMVMPSEDSVLATRSPIETTFG